MVNASVLSVVLALAVPASVPAGPTAVEGPVFPALTGEVFDRFLHYTEWVLNVRLTEAQREQARAQLKEVWANHQVSEVVLVLDTVAADADLVNHTETERTRLRRSVEDELVKWLSRRRTLEVGQWMLAVRDDALRPIAAGTPPLRRQAADAFAELMTFAINEIGVTEPLTLDDALLDEFARTLAADYRGYTPKLQQALASMPREWAELRAGWSRFSEEKRAQVRAELRKALASALEKSKTTQDAEKRAVFPLRGEPLRNAATELAGRLPEWR